MQQRAASYGVSPSQRPAAMAGGGSFPNAASQGFQRAGNPMGDVRRTQVAACRCGREVRSSDDGTDDAARHAAADQGDGRGGREK